MMQLQGLIPLRTLAGTEPVVIAPEGSTALWATCRRLRCCEIYALPDSAEIYDTFWWMQLFPRDTTLWPVDVPSAIIMTRILDRAFATERQRMTLDACRWAWGVPWADELGEPEAVIETLWCRELPDHH